MKFNIQRCLLLSFLTVSSGALATNRVPVNADLVGTAMEAHGAAPSSGDELFPRSELLAPRIGFWTNVFARYSAFQSVIHFQDEPEKIYAVLDFRNEAATLGEDRARRLQHKAEAAAKKEVNHHLRRAHDNRLHPEKLSPAERRVFDLLDGTRPDRYQKAIGRFRAQRGLKEATHKALQISGRYIDRMEQIFISEGLPVQLTRLPLVESSFNVNAYSKVGAAGLWQFIPASARIYMRLDEAVDQRRDPWASTRAAARHLKADYVELGSWPLAITAYNHGRGSLAYGLRKVKGTTLEDLIQRYESRRFGFASQNFYAEFLAALDVERNYREHFGEVQRFAPLEFDAVETHDYVAYQTLRRLSGIDDEAFHRLNPGYRPEVLDGRLHVPPQSQIRVPVGTAKAFKAAYARLDANERFSQQRFYYVRYKVRRGDNLGSIARRYGVSVRSLVDANGIRDPRLLRIGKTLKIPPRGGARAVQVARIDEGSRPSTHTVRPGQHLGGIARKYRTSIEALMQLNGLEDPRKLRSGSVLKIPSST